MQTIFIFLLLSIHSYAGKIALTFDDAPKAGMSKFSGDERTESLIKTFNKHSIKVVFYANSSRLKSHNGLNRMKRYDSAGHFIANHTHSHPNLDKVNVQQYINDIEKAHHSFKNFKNFRAWFRYPFLRHGNNIKKRDFIRDYLSKSGYSNGYVTIDNQDWFMASLLEKHLKSGGKVNEKKLCNTYSRMLWDAILYFDSAAKKYLNRSPVHSLLLHENDLAALCVNSLINKIKSEGWEIVSPEIAMADDIYSIKANTLFNNNGQIGALVHEIKGLKLADPWSSPGEKKIQDEFKKQAVFY